MRRVLIAMLFTALAGCTSPESTRTRGAGPGADTGNRGQPVLMHEGSKPYTGTPRRIGDGHVSLTPADHAHDLSVQ